MDDLFLAWLAGFVDGEGSLCLSISVRDGRWGKNLTFYPTITVTQHIAHRRHLDSICAKLGFGKVYIRGKKKAHYQPTNQSDAVRLIEMLSPFLVVKKRQAEEMKEALALLQEHSLIDRAARNGERALTYSAACRLVDIAVGLNPRLNDEEIRYGKGRSKEDLLAIVNDIYNPYGYATTPEVVEAQSRRIVEISCAQCGKPVERYFSALSESGKAFCSRSCTAQYSAAHRSSDIVAMICAYCAQNFERRACDIKSTKRNYCSSSCKNKSGSLRYKVRHGLTKEYL